MQLPFGGVSVSGAISASRLRNPYAGLRVEDWAAAADKRTWDRHLCACIQNLFG